MKVIVIVVATKNDIAEKVVTDNTHSHYRSREESMGP